MSVASTDVFYRGVVSKLEKMTIRSEGQLSLDLLRTMSV